MVKLTDGSYFVLDETGAIVHFDRTGQPIERVTNDDSRYGYWLMLVEQFQDTHSPDPEEKFD